MAPGRATSELYQIDEHRKIHQSSTIESGMKSALMTGNWGSRTAPRSNQVLNDHLLCDAFPPSPSIHEYRQEQQTDPT
jgi:hypothetical protein